MMYSDLWVLPSSESRLTGAEAERFEAGRPIAAGFREVFRLAERMRRQDEREAVLRLMSNAT